MSSFLKQRAVQILLLGYASGISWTVWIYVTGQVDTFNNYIGSLVFLGIFPVLGGISGILLSRKWGFLSSALGRTIFFLSAGVIAWGVGSVIWGYYNLILGVEVPYPGFGDIGYSLSYLLFVLGLINLGKGIGAGYKLRTWQGKITLVLVSLFGFAITYYVFLIAKGGDFGLQDVDIIMFFLNIYYPLGDAVMLAITSLIYGLSYKILGGRFKWPINLLFITFLWEYAADLSFTYTTTQGTYYVGNWNDFFFVSFLYALLIGINTLNIQGISSRVRTELTMFAPRASEAINNLVSEIIQRQVSIIGPVAWDEALKVPGLVIDIKNNRLSVEGDPKNVLEQLVGRYEGLFGNASLQICKEAANKFVSQISPEQIPEVLR